MLWHVDFKVSYLYDFKQLVKFAIQLFVIQLSWICITVNSVNRASCLTQGMQVQNCAVVIRKMNLNHISSTSCALDGTRIHGISRPNYCYCHLEDIIGTTRVGRVWIPHVAGCWEEIIQQVIEFAVVSAWSDFWSQGEQLPGCDAPKRENGTVHQF